MDDVPSHLLIFEPDHRGHVLEWVQHILAAAAASPRPPKLTFVVTRDIAGSLAGSTRGGAQVEFLALTEPERHFCNHRRLAVSGLARWWVARKYLRRTGAQRILFLAFDHLSLPLGLGLSLNGCLVSGILFRPSVHYAGLNGGRGSLAERLRDLRKHALYGRMLQNRSVQRVFSLDPYFPGYAALRYVAGEKVTALADPAYPPPRPTRSEMAWVDFVPADRTTFLFFGEITERKGILQLLSALSLIPGPAARQIAVVIAGRIDPLLKDQINQCLSAVRHDRPALWLHVEDRRLSSGEIAAVLQRADVVLAPYQRFVGSSGVLLWAAQFAKPVITQDYGLVGQLTREYALGLAIDANDPRAIADAITIAVDYGPQKLGNPDRMTDYAAAHSVEHFGEHLLGLGALDIAS